MNAHNLIDGRYSMMIAAASMAIALFVATQAVAAPAPDLAQRYSAWAGGSANARALVSGLASGSSIVLTTSDGAGSRSVAGFSAPRAMAPGEVDAALAQARRTLAAMGIRNPTAEQIQAALIGGEVTAQGGGTRLVQGAIGGAGG